MINDERVCPGCGFSAGDVPLDTTGHDVGGVACLTRQLAAANERAENEKNHRVAYQDHIYACCAAMDRVFSRSLCGGEGTTVDQVAADITFLGRLHSDAIADRDRRAGEVERMREFMHRVCDSQRQRKAPMPTGGGNPIYYFDTNAIHDAIAWLNNANEMAAMGRAAGQKEQP